MNLDKKSIKKSLLIPIIISLIILYIVFIFVFIGFKRVIINKEIQNISMEVQNLFQNILFDDINIMRKEIDTLDIEIIKNTWLKNDREGLYDYTLPILNEVSSYYGITRFYFIETNRTAFLRVYNPEKYGDIISHYSLIEAVNTGNASFGIELSKYGYLALRVVSPLLIDNEIVGFIEMGMKMEYMLWKLKKTLDNDYFIIIDKNYLNEELFSNSFYKQSGAEDWNKFSNYVVIDKTLPVTPVTLNEYLSYSHNKHVDKIIKLNMDKNIYYLAFIPLYNSGNEDIGDIVAMINIEEFESSIAKLTIFLVIFFYIIGMILFIYLYFYIGNVGNDLEKAYNELEDEIKLRSGVEAKLFEINKKLGRSNEELKQFTYIASHDLKEPLRTVASYVQLIAKRYKDKLDNDGNDFIKFAVDGVKRMEQLINDLLEYSRVSNQKIKFSKIDCEVILNKTLANLKNSINERKVVITHDPLPTINADERQMISLFQNLISNAIKYSENTPHIHISALSNENKWTFSIKDNGIGIENKYFDNIFNIFERLHGNGEYSGTGIGLAICKKIIDLHNGIIWIESQPGKGSTFYFTIPIETAKAD